MESHVELNIGMETGFIGRLEDLRPSVGFRARYDPAMHAKRIWGSARPGQS